MQKVQELSQSFSLSERHSYTLLIPLELSIRLQANPRDLYLKDLYFEFIFLF